MKENTYRIYYKNGKTLDVQAYSLRYEEGKLWKSARGLVGAMPEWYVGEAPNVERVELWNGENVYMYYVYTEELDTDPSETREDSQTILLATEDEEEAEMFFERYRKTLRAYWESHPNASKQYKAELHRKFLALEREIQNVVEGDVDILDSKIVKTYYHIKYANVDNVYGRR